MSSTTATTLTIDQLRLSPFNVRVDERDTSDIGVLAASILEKGLIQAINAHPMRGQVRQWGVFAGGRRYRAIKGLIESGDLPRDYAVKVVIYDGHTDGQLVELSIGENMLRRDLRDYEKFRGVRRAHDMGESIQAIGAALGQEPRVIARWLRLGALPGPIFAAFQAEQITIEHAMAYGGTADPDLQLATFEQMMELPDWQRTPEKIRAAMKIGDSSANRLLRLVGETAYRDAGGRFELDLFADEAQERGRVVDEDKLRALAEARLTGLRDATRAAVGRDIRFVARPPQTVYELTDWDLQISVRADDDGSIRLPDGDIVAWIELPESGEPSVTYWWASRSAKYGSAKRPAADRPKATAAAAISDPHFYAAPARAAIKEEHGVAADALEAIRSMRRELLRALIVEDAQRGGERGRDFATWAALRVALCPGKTSDVGARGLGRADAIGAVDVAEKARLQVEQHTAHDIWLGAVRAISRETFITESDAAAAFVDFLNASAETKALAGAVMAGFALDRSANAPGYEFATHDALAQMSRGDARTLRKLWRPTAEFFELFPKSQLLAIAAPFLDETHRAQLERAKGFAIAEQLAQAMTGATAAIPGRNRAAAAEWVHPLLTFRQLDFEKRAAATDAVPA